MNFKLRAETNISFFALILLLIIGAFVFFFLFCKSIECYKFPVLIVNAEDARGNNRLDNHCFYGQREFAHVHRIICNHREKKNHNQNENVYSNAHQVIITLQLT